MADAPKYAVNDVVVFTNKGVATEGTIYRIAGERTNRNKCYVIRFFQPNGKKKVKTLSIYTKNLKKVGEAQGEDAVAPSGNEQEEGDDEIEDHEMPNEEPKRKKMKYGDETREEEMDVGEVDEEMDVYTTGVEEELEDDEEELEDEQEAIDDEEDDDSAHDENDENTAKAENEKLIAKMKRLEAARNAENKIVKLIYPQEIKEAMVDDEKKCTEKEKKMMPVFPPPKTVRNIFEDYLDGNPFVKNFRKPWDFKEIIKHADHKKTEDWIRVKGASVIPLWFDRFLPNVLLRHEERRVLIDIAEKQPASAPILKPTDRYGFIHLIRFFAVLPKAEMHEISLKNEVESTVAPFMKFLNDNIDKYYNKEEDFVELPTAE